MQILIHMQIPMRMAKISNLIRHCSKANSSLIIIRCQTPKNKFQPWSLLCKQKFQSGNIPLLALHISHDKTAAIISYDQSNSFNHHGIIPVFIYMYPVRTTLGVSEIQIPFIVKIPYMPYLIFIISVKELIKGGRFRMS